MYQNSFCERILCINLGNKVNEKSELRATAKSFIRKYGPIKGNFRNKPVCDNNLESSLKNFNLNANK